MVHPDSLIPAAGRAVASAREFSFGCMKDDGHWVAECFSNVTFTAEYVFFCQGLGLGFGDDNGESLCRWILSQQNPDGSWGLAPGYRGDCSTTAEAYLALKILDIPSDDVRMKRAREFTVRSGGIETVRMFTRFFLATFGLLPWTSIPQLPPELILLPTISPINIYNLSSWARSTTIPLLIIRHHEPVYALPNGISTNNDFLDELWVNPSNKDIPYGLPLAQPWGYDPLEYFFTLADKALSMLSLLKHLPSRTYARNECVKWLLDHQEDSGDWAGFWPPQHNSIWALLAEGYSLKDPIIRRGFNALNRLIISDDLGRRAVATVSPVWDTVLMTMALGDSKSSSNKRSLQQTISWIKSYQLTGPEGDWRIKSPNLAPGGWSFEYFNTWFPDVDDSACALLALLKQDRLCINSSTVVRGATWILGMQNADGGWGAFDKDNNYLFLNRIPFSDMNSLCDPSTADVTGRIVECLGTLIKSPYKNLLDPNFLSRMERSAARGISYLRSEQCKSGAWWGRWGCNYIYGTSNVLCGLSLFAEHDESLKTMIDPAISFLKRCQNTDGGFGETLESYIDPGLAGKGPSTAPQSAWGAMGLLAHLPPTNQAIRKCVGYLVSSQVKEEGKPGKTWPMLGYTGTGFPNCLYLEYSLYPHYFPLMALGRWMAKAEESTLRIE